MLIERRLRLLTPILAAKRSNDPTSPRRVFVRAKVPPKGDPDLAYIRSDLPRWTWAFLEARDALELDDVSLGAVMPSHWYATKKTSTFHRRFREGKTARLEPFESIPGNQILTMRFTLSKHVPPNTDGNGRFTRPPDEQEFDEMLAYIGEELGMSEWGHSQKFGRFEIRTANNDARRNQLAEAGPAAVVNPDNPEEAAPA